MQDPVYITFHTEIFCTKILYVFADHYIRVAYHILQCNTNFFIKNITGRNITDRRNAKYSTAGFIFHDKIEFDRAMFREFLFQLGIDSYVSIHS